MVLLIATWGVLRLVVVSAMDQRFPCATPFDALCRHSARWAGDDYRW